MLLVTGGAGFIGSHLVARLVAEGEQVRVFDNFSSGRWQNLAPLLDDIEIIVGDVRDEGAVRRAVTDVDTVFHLAAVPSVQSSVTDPRFSVDVNVGGAMNFLIAARDAGCRRFVFTSSSSIYGDRPESPKTEEMTPQPLSSYAVSKLAGEHLCASFTQLYGLETVALRYFNVFGPRQDPNSAYAAVIPKFASALAQGEIPVIYGDGGQSRDFIHVDNVVHANRCAARAPEASGKVFNIASGNGVSLNELVLQLAELFGTQAMAKYEPARAGDIRHSLADISRARSILNYDVVRSFEDGLRDTVEHMCLKSGMVPKSSVGPINDVIVTPAASHWVPASGLGPHPIVAAAREAELFTADRSTQ